MRPYALVYLYRRRLRVHTVQELLAGLGVAIAVALVFAVMIANGSIAAQPAKWSTRWSVPRPCSCAHATRTASTNACSHASNTSPASHRPRRCSSRPRRSCGPRGRRVTVDLAGTDISLAILDGLAHTLPIATLSPGGDRPQRDQRRRTGHCVRQRAGGRDARGFGDASREGLSAEGRRRAGTRSVRRALAGAGGGDAARTTAASSPACGDGSRASWSQPRPGREAAVRGELDALAGGGLTVAPADQDVASVAPGAAPERSGNRVLRRDQRAARASCSRSTRCCSPCPSDARRSPTCAWSAPSARAIVQMVIFQALCLGLAASLAGLLVGYVLSRDVFHQPAGYLAEAFTLGTRTVVGVQPLLVALIGGIAATCLASMVPLLDLRRGRTLDAVYVESGRTRQRARHARSAAPGARRRRPARVHDHGVRCCAPRSRSSRVRCSRSRPCSRSR